MDVLAEACTFRKFTFSLTIDHYNVVLDLVCDTEENAAQFAFPAVSNVENVSGISLRGLYGFTPTDCLTIHNFGSQIAMSTTTSQF